MGEEQPRFLTELLETNSTISVYLIHGVKLTGKLIGFSDKVIFLGEPVPQMIYKRSISTIIIANSD